MSLLEDDSAAGSAADRTKNPAAFWNSKNSTATLSRLGLPLHAGFFTQSSIQETC